MATDFDPDLYLATFDASHDAIMIREGAHYIDCNETALRLFKFPSKEAFLKVGPADYSPPRQPDGSDSGTAAARHIARALTEGSDRFDWLHRDREGREFHCEVWLTRFEWRGRQLLRATVRDISARKEAEARSVGINRAYFESLFENSPEGIAILDNQDRIVDTNGSFEELFGYTRSELRGCDLNDCIVPARFLDEATSASRQALAGEPVPALETLRRRKDGSEVRVAVIGVPVYLEETRLGVCGIYRDMTAQWEAAERIRESEARLRTVIGNSPIILFALDKNGVFTLADGKALASAALEPGELVGRSVFEVYARQPRLLAEVRRALAGESRTFLLNIGKAAFETQYAPIFDVDGSVKSVIGVAHDVTETLAIKHRLEHMAHHDALTNLPNRSLFQTRAREAIARAERRGRQFALLFVDLDSFKNVNDSLGHAAGDRVLQEVAARFRTALRDSDTVTRLGGDEFAVIIDAADDPHAAAVVARKLLAALAEPIDEGDIPLGLSASIGISLYPADGSDVDTLLTNADAAMYKAKEARNSYRFYTAEMNQKALETLVLNSKLRSALDRSEFMLHYQPSRTLADGTLTGFEALLRWHHPERGVVRPAEFIPLAEETGLIVPLGEWVLGEACRQARAWRGHGHRPLRIAVNLSAKQLQSQRFVDRVRHFLDAAELPPETLLLEVTESMMFPNPAFIRELLEQLSSLRVGIAVDDFGTGYSSLGYLRDFPIDYLKIDQSFVASIPDDASACTITNTIIAMAKNLGLRVIAEGVENDAQLDFLRAAGCDEAQGFYYSQPVSAELAEALLRDEAAAPALP